MFDHQVPGSDRVSTQNNPNRKTKEIYSWVYFGPIKYILGSKTEENFLTLQSVETGVIRMFHVGRLCLLGVTRLR